MAACDQRPEVAQKMVDVMMVMTYKKQVDACYGYRVVNNLEGEGQVTPGHSYARGSTASTARLWAVRKKIAGSQGLL
jgi:hypothetical protein